jgi:cytochrome c
MMMRKILLMGLIGFLMSCGGSNDKKTGTTDTGNDLSGNPVYEKGLQLVSKNDCLMCHKVDQAVNGPAYRDVANKYAGYPDTIVQYLAKKIIHGGTGTWGSVFMTPHPSLSQEDAESLVKYVLLLKK